MIEGMQGLFFTEETEEAREFLREKLDFEHVDAGDGWLIFAVPEAEVAVHPLMDADEGFHQLSFWCDDIEETVRELEERGVTFTEPIADEGFGLTTMFEIPGGVPVQLYEPKHEQPGS